MTPDEGERIKDLHNYNILDTEPEEAFERITRVAKSALRVPIALISLVDVDRQWFKSRQGLEVQETSRAVSFCSHAICGETPLIVNDATKDIRFRDNPLVTWYPNIRFYAGVPLRTPQGHNLGTLCVIDTVPRELNETEILVLQDLARLVVDELELRQVALTDSLTGAHTRRSFDIQLEREIERARRHTLIFSMITFDIDHLAQINEMYGRGIGDIILQTFASQVYKHLQEADVFARIGGGEFAVILPHTGVVGAMGFAEQLREAFSSQLIEVLDMTLHVTASFGVTAFTSSAESAGDYLRRTNAALNQAKKDGGNRISTFAYKEETDRVA